MVEEIHRKNTYEYPDDVLNRLFLNNFRTGVHPRVSWYGNVLLLRYVS